MNKRNVLNLIVGAALVLVMGHDIRLEQPAGSIVEAE